ncbi:hypothetical protein [Curvibacter sp. PAE-UM]|uniref:hypothetical protein n=1 Tax=Curvibacter sp. PAE-UM TaxID=1714344 RepID=UPI0012E39FDE|nr:hypothetical protein [Curvibacter sp. PAE-UM]
MTPEEELIAVGEIAAKALAHMVATLPTFQGPDGHTYSIRVVNRPEISGKNWMLVADVVLPDQTRTIEFSIVQTGWGGFVPGASK